MTVDIESIAAALEARDRERRERAVRDPRGYLAEQQARYRAEQEAGLPEPVRKAMRLTDAERARLEAVDADRARAEQALDAAHRAGERARREAFEAASRERDPSQPRQEITWGQTGREAEAASAEQQAWEGLRTSLLRWNGTRAAVSRSRQARVEAAWAKAKKGDR